MSDIKTAIADLSKALLENSRTIDNAYTRELMRLAADSLIKQAELLVSAGKMVDKSLTILNEIAEFKKQVIH